MYNSGYPPQQQQPPRPQQYPPQGYPPQGYPPPHGAPPQGYGGPPPPNAGYGAPPPQGYAPPPPQGYPPPQQGYGHAPPPNIGYQAPPQHQQYGQQPPPPAQGYGHPPPTQPGYHSPAPAASAAGYYGAPPPHSAGHHAPPQPPAAAAPSHYAAPGYGHAPPPVIPNVSTEVSNIHKACRGLGTDERTLISIFATRDGQTIDAIRRSYSHGDLISILNSETSGNFRIALLACAWGPTDSLTFWAHKAIAGAGTKEPMLTEAIMGNPQHVLIAMKELYHRQHQQTLEAAVRGDLSMKTEKLFVMALEGANPHTSANQRQASTDAHEFYGATKRRLGTDEIKVCGLLTRNNNAQIYAMVDEYQKHYKESFVERIKKEFSGHMRDALLYIVEGVLDPVKRDAQLLEAAMKGFGTKDELLIMRLVRCHWNRVHMESVKNKYRQLYGRSLADRVRGETSGKYRDMLLAIIG